jgi:chemotaxis protein CheZ
MAERRKVFRIEETAAVRGEPAADDGRKPRLAEIMQELSELRALLTDRSVPARAETGGAGQDQIERLTSALRDVQATIAGTNKEPATGNGQAVPAARIISELDAAVATSEQAAQKILAAAEDIDQAANNLSAALKDDIERGLAQDVRDRVIQIFEACNYQDLASQRVAKVTAALHRIERQIGRLLNEPARNDAAPPVQGPRLAPDSGHVSQSDIDAMFAAEVKSA